MSNGLILRVVQSPYNGDTAKLSVLSLTENDNNFVLLRGQDINSISLSGNTLTLNRLNGDMLSVTLTGFSGGNSVILTGGTYSGGTLTLNDSSGNTVTVTGFTNQVLYTNLTPTTATVGGITAGSTFSAQTMQQMWDNLLYPYQNPAFTSFSISNPYGQLEIGRAIPDGQNFQWATSNTSNVQSNSINISGANFSGVTAQPNNGYYGPVNFTSPLVLNAIGSLSWNISATNTKSQSFNTSTSLSWSIRWYYGKSANSTVTQSDITGFTSNLVTSVTNSYVTLGATSGPQYGYLIVPTTLLSQPSNLVNSTSGCFGNNIPYSNIGTVTFNNTYGVSVTYNIYKTTNPFAGSQSVWLCP